MSEVVDVLEALLFASDAPIEAERIQEVLELDSPAAARELVDALGRRLDGEGRALQVLEVGGGFRLVTRPEVAPWLVKLQRSKTKSRLSRPASPGGRTRRDGRSSTRPRASSSLPSVSAT